MPVEEISIDNNEYLDPVQKAEHSGLLNDQLWANEPKQTILESASLPKCDSPLEVKYDPKNADEYSEFPGTSFFDVLINGTKWSFAPKFIP